MKSEINILMVEEDRYEVDCLKEAITAGHIITVHIEHVEDGDQALAYLHQEYPFLDAQKPDLIFINLNLPGMAGAELLEEIRRDDLLESIPVVALTTSEQDKDLMDAYSLDGNCFFFKKPDTCHQWLFVLQRIEDVWQTLHL